jgi:hypothetical protein
MSLAFGLNYPEFDGNNHLTLAQNMLSSSAYVAKQGNEGGPAFKKVVAVSDVVLPTTAIILGTVEATQAA